MKYKNLNKMIKTFQEFILEKNGQDEEWQVIFTDDENDVPYTIETFKTKKLAENWADDREYDYQDEWYNPHKEDYEFKTFYRYHNPEDQQSYTGYEVKKLK